LRLRRPNRMGSLPRGTYVEGPHDTGGEGGNQALDMQKAVHGYRCNIKETLDPKALL